jgi:hypothetical protein
MKKIILLCLAVAISCAGMAQATEQPDSLQINNTINSFYKWYNKNWQTVPTFTLYRKIKRDPPYAINWKEVERYLAWLRKNAPQLGEEFHKNERIFFKECDSAFKIQVQDEVPYGFDGDRFTNSQELPDYIIDEMKKAKQWAIKVDGNNATVDVLGSYDDKGKEIETLIICFEMKKEKGKWTIAKIGCRFAAQ